MCEGTTTTLTNAALVPEARRLTDRYDFLAELGRGGMGIVYLARDRSNGERVAIKLLGMSPGDMSQGQRTDAALRFAREARTVAGLKHANIVRTLTIEELAGDTIAIVTEYVPGQNLRALLREAGPLPFGRATMLLRDIASALAYAHQFRIVHRDVKPENIFVEESGTRALLADFGIARPIDADVQITSDGSSLGTPAYMAPEQVRGGDVDERADVYSLGLVGWEMLTGQRPWEGETLYDVLHKQQHERLPSLVDVRPDIPAYLLTAIEGAIGKRPAERWANGAELLARLTPLPAALPARRVRDDRSWWDEQTVQVARPMLADALTLPMTAAPVGDTVADTPAAPVAVPPVAVRADERFAPPSSLPEAERFAPPVTEPIPEPVAERVAEPVVPEPVVPEPVVPEARSATRSPRPRRVTPEKLKVWGPMLTAIMAAVIAWVMLGGKQEPQAVDGLPSKASVEYPALDTVPVAAPPTPAAPSAKQQTTQTSAGTLSPDSATPAIKPRATPVTEPRATPPATVPRVTSPPTEPPAKPPAPVVRESPRPAATRTSPTRTAPTRPAPTRPVPTRPAPTRPAPTRPAPTPPAAAAPAESPSRTASTGTACSTPTSSAQRACLIAEIERNDAELNRTYLALINEMRREAGGVREPRSVQALRVEQRAWVNQRDRACRSDGVSAGTLWGAERAPCFAQWSDSRAAVLRGRLEERSGRD